MIVQPETVARSRREVWSTFWRYMSLIAGAVASQVSHEVRELIVRMLRENFLWCAPSTASCSCSALRSRSRLYGG